MNLSNDRTMCYLFTLFLLCCAYITIIVPQYYIKPEKIPNSVFISKNIIKSATIHSSNDAAKYIAIFCLERSGSTWYDIA
jgi:hypothetical protein